MQQKTKYRLSIILGALAALIYIVIPTDLSPDPVPVIGWIDDIARMYAEQKSRGLLFQF